MSTPEERIEFYLQAHADERGGRDFIDGLGERFGETPMLYASEIRAVLDELKAARAKLATWDAQREAIRHVVELWAHTTHLLPDGIDLMMEDIEAARLQASCDQCHGSGVTAVKGCTCGMSPASCQHEQYCEFEPCPNRCEVQPR